MKIIKGTVTINGKLYTAFEMFDGGPWKIVEGTRHGDDTVAKNIIAKTANQAIYQWLEGKHE